MCPLRSRNRKTITSRIGIALNGRVAVACIRISSRTVSPEVRIVYIVLKCPMADWDQYTANVSTRVKKIV